jgi:hypothetical protein
MRRLVPMIRILAWIPGTRFSDVAGDGPDANL